MLDIQRDLRARLARAFPDAPVKISVPAERPCPLVVVTREGGRRINGLLDRPGVGIYIWDESESKVEKLSDAVADFMDSLSFSDGYELVEQETSLSATDPDTREPRWYLSYTITTHEPKG